MEWVRGMKAVKRMFARRKDEADLNKESGSAAMHYVKKSGQIHLAEHQQIINWVAHGFYMGYRKCEEEHGIERRDSYGRKS